MRWLTTHDLFEQEVPKNLQYPGWCRDVYVALSELAVIEHNDKAYDLLDDFHEAVIVNAVFCWAMKQPHCPKDSLCTLCNKPARNTNVIV